MRSGLLVDDTDRYLSGHLPYNGGITSLESLWMGVPVITRTGRTFVSRITGSYLRCLDRQNWIAATEEDYMEKACVLASDIERLGNERETLRNRLGMSPLREGKSFTRNLEALYLKMIENEGRTNVTV